MLYSFCGIRPSIGEGVFIADGVKIVGNVSIKLLTIPGLRRNILMLQTTEIDD